MRSLQSSRERVSSSASSASPRVVSRGCVWVCEPTSQPASARRPSSSHDIGASSASYGPPSQPSIPAQVIGSSRSAKLVTVNTVAGRPNSERIGRARSITER